MLASCLQVFLFGLNISVDETVCNCAEQIGRMSNCEALSFTTELMLHLIYLLVLDLVDPAEGSEQWPALP